MGFAEFWGGKSFPVNRTDLKIVANWHYNWCPNATENFQNLRKLVQSLCAPHWPFRSELKEKFYHSLLPHCIVEVHPYKKYFGTLFATKNVKFAEVVPKMEGSTTICAHQNTIKLCNF